VGWWYGSSSSTINFLTLIKRVTVMNSPSIMATLCQGNFISNTRNIIQPEICQSTTVFTLSRVYNTWIIIKTFTEHLCVKFSETISTNSFQFSPSIDGNYSSNRIMNVLNKYLLRPISCTEKLNAAICVITIMIS